MRRDDEVNLLIGQPVPPTLPLPPPPHAWTWPPALDWFDWLWQRLINALAIAAFIMAIYAIVLVRDERHDRRRCCRVAPQPQAPPRGCRWGAPRGAAPSRSH